MRVPRPRPPDKKALRRSFWAALGRLLGISMTAGAGSLIYQVVGSSTSLAIGVAGAMAVVGFLLSWFTEYEREREL